MANDGFGGILRDMRDAIGGIFSGGRIDEQQRMPIEVVFGLIGWLAKADGVITSHEAEFANRLMDELELPTQGRAIANASFDRGRLRQVNAAQEVRRFMQVHPKGSDELLRLYNTLLRLAAADGRVFARERTALETLTDAFGFPRKALDVRLEAIRAAAAP